MISRNQNLIRQPPSVQNSLENPSRITKKNTIHFPFLNDLRIIPGKKTKNGQNRKKDLHNISNSIIQQFDPIFNLDFNKDFLPFYLNKHPEGIKFRDEYLTSDETKKIVLNKQKKYEREVNATKKISFLNYQAERIKSKQYLVFSGLTKFKLLYSSSSLSDYRSWIKYLTKEFFEVDEVIGDFIRVQIHPILKLIGKHYDLIHNYRKITNGTITASDLKSVISLGNFTVERKDGEYTATEVISNNFWIKKLVNGTYFEKVFKNEICVVTCDESHDNKNGKYVEASIRTNFSNMSPKNLITLGSWRNGETRIQNIITHHTWRRIDNYFEKTFVCTDLGFVFAIVKKKFFCTYCNADNPQDMQDSHYGRKEFGKRTDFFLFMKSFFYLICLLHMFETLHAQILISIFSTRESSEDFKDVYLEFKKCVCDFWYNAGTEDVRNKISMVTIHQMDDIERNIDEIKEIIDATEDECELLDGILELKRIMFVPLEKKPENFVEILERKIPIFCDRMYNKGISGVYLHILEKHYVDLEKLVSEKSGGKLSLYELSNLPQEMKFHNNKMESENIWCNGAQNIRGSDKVLPSDFVNSMTQRNLEMLYATVTKIPEKIDFSKLEGLKRIYLDKLLVKKSRKRKRDDRGGDRNSFTFHNLFYNPSRCSKKQKIE